MSLSVPCTPQRYQEPQIGLEHCGLKLRDTGEQVRKKLREEFTLPMLVRASGSPAFVRLVHPGPGSVSECCSYLLFTDTKLIVHNGHGAPISARSKIAQMAHEIIAGKELPTSATRVQIADDDRKVEAQFWKELRTKKSEAGDEQQLDEKGKENMMDTETGDEQLEHVGEDAVYEINEDGTVGVVARGQRPNCGILDPAKVLIFYFVSEIYVWTGSDSHRTLIGPAMAFARSLREELISDRAKRIICASSNSPPAWSLFRRLPEGIVDTLFKHKFEKWRDPGKKPKRIHHHLTIQRPMSVPCRPPVADTRNCDENALVREMATKMATECPKVMELVLEDTALRPEDGNVFTEGLKIYEMEGECLREMREQGQNEPEMRLVDFEQDKCYVIGWEYRVERAGIRKLDGSEAEQRECGRRRRCYFYWLGADTTVGEQSRCALALRDWDAERREHIRVEAGAEPPMLLHVLGGLVISGTGSGVYAVIGSSGQQCIVKELRAPVLFRAQGAYLRVFPDRIECLRGQDCPEKLVQCAMRQARKLAVSRKLQAPKEAKSLRENLIRAKGWTKAPRLFRFHDNEVWELACPNAESNFTFQQKDLSDCMFVDQGNHLWVWSADHHVPSLGLKIAFRYWYGESYSSGGDKCIVGDKSTASVICAGAEPDEFRALFAEWAATEVKESPGDESPQSLYAVIAERLKTRPVEQLRRRELPPGCDTRRLEDYLSERDFERVFRMGREQFGQLPRWKQLAMKKDADLF